MKTIASVLIQILDKSKKIVPTNAECNMGNVFRNILYLLVFDIANYSTIPRVKCCLLYTSDAADE